LHFVYNGMYLISFVPSTSYNPRLRDGTPLTNGTLIPGIQTAYQVQLQR
jgi:hypothetical protein